MNGIGAVLWDMDGTLIDSEPNHHAALAKALTQAGLPVGPDFAEQFIGRPIVAIHEEVSREHGLTITLEDLAHDVYTAYLGMRGTLTPRDGALSVWRALAEAGVAQALVSNSDRMILGANIERLGLQRPGLVSVSINDVRNGKPAAEPYLRAAYLLGIEPARCVVVEDSPTGARAGLAAGMRVIGWPQGHYDLGAFPEGAAVYVGHDLAGFIETLGQP